jgi:hypothetical protein
MLKICVPCRAEWKKDKAAGPIGERTKIVPMPECSICAGTRPGEYRGSQSGKLKVRPSRR